MSQELNNYVNVLEIDGENAISVYYFDNRGKMKFLDASHYELDVGSRQITIKNDGNVLVSTRLLSREFYVSFIPEGSDRELSSYRFTYDPSSEITSTLNVTNWNVIGLDSLDVIPIVDAYYFMNEKESTLKSVVCQASQIAAYLSRGKELEFNLTAELGSFDLDLLTGVHSGDYLALYIDTNIRNLESLENITVELYDNQGLMSGLTQVITVEDLIMFDNNIKINLPITPNTLKTIKLIPSFKTDEEYSDDNARGFVRIQPVQWDNGLTTFMENGQEYMHIALEYDLMDNNSNLAYIFNDKLEHLTFAEDYSIFYTSENDAYLLHVPSTYFNAETSETMRFQNEQVIVVKYNSPVKKGIAVGIGKINFENKGYNYDSHPDIPKAELLLINTNSTSAYSEFNSDYYYKVPLQLTPFDTEFNGRTKAVKIELNLTSLFKSEGVSELDFSHLIFSVPNPCYELTISEVVLLETSFETSSEYGSKDSRVWQYSEVEIFTASATPEDDLYQLTLENVPLFYPEIDWLDFVNIYDEDGNYYSAGLTGNDHQLHFEPSSNTFTWNPSFNQFPEYFGMAFEEPLVIEPNKTLYFEYATNMSWVEPIRIEEENLDLDSLRVVFDYNYLLKPEHYDWLSEFGTVHSYENIAYSFKEESEYRVVQYYYEAFTVYANVSQYTHAFDIGNLTFENDFVNLTLYKIIGLTPTLESEILTNNANFSIDFNEASNKITINDLNSDDGLLSVFDQITVILNYSYGPISSYSEIYLLDEFNQTYLTDQEETFYSSLDIDYNFKSESGTALFAEGSATINSDATTFEAIDYCRNPDMSADNKLVGYGSELFDNFEIYEDDSSIIYVADIDMDGEPDYKHVIDVDRDGEIDIVKYGIDDPQGSGEISWHTVIQDFHNEETKVSRELEEEMRTEWFDLNDQLFAHYDFNVAKLLLIVVTLPLLTYHITKMMIPDVDYWAQKSTQRLVSKEEHVKSTFYSVQVDDDQDGFVDSQINFESTDVDVYYEVNEFKKTILAAKYQDIFTFLGEYVLRSISSLFTGSQEDFVFNEYLTEEHLETKDFSKSNLGAKMNAAMLSATYRKFTKNITTTYVDSFKYSTLTVIDYNEGEVEEQRIYKDNFITSEGTSAEGFFEDLSSEHAITNVDTGAQSTVRFDPEIPYSHPANISWEGETWGSDNVQVKYDSLQVIGEDYSYSTNYFEKTIIIRIPNRYSLYNDFGKTSRSKVENDGWVEFEVEGVFITPEDGQVYYTSDVHAFKDGTAKTKGHYFYVDSDLNGFYETVYIISNLYTVSRSGTPKYDVISIGLNYDGIHDFAPYEKLDQKVESTSDFSNLAKESAMFGFDWVYNFNNLEHNELLMEKETIWDEYKPKDQIFEIHKLVDMSENNPKFSELFYEIRHKTYAKAWEEYKIQLTGDIIEQVFMSVTAALLSAAVDTIVSSSITAATLGIGLAAAKTLGSIAGTMTYVAVYTLMTKFSIDRKLHEAESKERSITFYPASNAKVDPESLNEKCIYDRILQDTMAAALLAHPGGYYQTVSVGVSGESYTGHLVVSPPNLARVWNSFGGFLDLLGENFWNAGESDPDAYFALDFDDLNLDYLLMSSELPFYNTKPYYTYHNTEFIFDTYNMYSFNTLGALETQVREGSGGQFDAIRPTCIDGAPQYEFIDYTVYNTVLPQQILYRPVVLSGTRYNQTQPALGRLTVTVQCKDYDKTLGINPYNMSEIEQKVYEAKVPLNENGFEYPIKYIYIDVVVYDVFEGLSYFAQDLMVNESDYTIDCGNLYFTKSLEAIILEKYSDFEDFLSQTWANGIIKSTMYYNVRVIFDRFVPDTTDETNSLALAQATSYAIMNYFNQYVYAEVSANMISEIAYTETMTFWSTLISAPLVYFGSWAVKGTEGMMSEASVELIKTGVKTKGQVIKRMILKGLAGMALSPIMEVFQEIIEDGFKEALAENIVGILGGTDDLGFWVSSYWTAGREAQGALGQLSLGAATNLKTTISLIHAVSSGDIDTILEIQQSIAQDLKQRQEKELAKRGQMSFLDKLLKTDFLKGLFMVIPSVFFGSFSFIALSGLNKMVTSVIKLSPAVYAEHASLKHNGRKRLIGKAIGDQEVDSISNKVLEQTRKPSELDSVALDINNEFKDQQETGILSPPQTVQTRTSNPNPKNAKISNILTKFKNLISSTWSDKFEAKKTEDSFVVEDIDKIVEESVQSKKPDVKLDKIIGDDFEGLFPEHDKDTILNDIYSRFFDPKYDQDIPIGKLDKLIYMADLALEARDFLETTKYNGLDIILAGGINYKVFAILNNKYENGEEFSKLERIIADVGCYYMGGPPPIGDSDSTSDTTNVHKKDANSPMGKLTVQNKKNRLKQIILDQLQHYSQTGERLYSKKEVLTKSGFSYLSVLKHAPIILEQIFIDPMSAGLIYDMIFGKITTSYQKKKEECLDKGLILKTTSTQWFDMLKNRGDKTPSQLYVVIECKEEGHENSILISQIQGCRDCSIANSIANLRDFGRIPLGLKKVLDLANERNIQAISFKDKSQQLTEGEFNELVKIYNAQHQDSNDYKTGKLSYINLRWKCLECDRVFERTYFDIKRSKIKHYCPSCISSIDSQMTLERTEIAFQGHITQDFRSNEQLYKFLPKRILLMDDYKVLRHPNVHVDAYGVIYVAGKEFKIAIEHHGPQHYSLTAYTNLKRGQDVKRGIYKTDAEYEIMYYDQVKRDGVKVQLFEDLNKEGYYLIVVPYRVPPSERISFILREFIKQTRVNPGLPSIADYL